jgi:hypothetical protein
MRKIVYSLLIVVAAGVCFAGCGQNAAAPKKEQAPSVTKPASDEGSQTKEKDQPKPETPKDGSGTR